MAVLNKFGRKPLNIPVKNVYDTLQHSSSISQAAEKLGCSRGYIYKVLAERGNKPLDVLKGG